MDTSNAQWRTTTSIIRATNEFKHGAISDHEIWAKKSTKLNREYKIDYIICHVGKAQIRDMSWDGTAP